MMRNVLHFCCVLVLVSCISAFHSRGSSAQIVINEFIADPARDWDGDGALSARDDEWIEIINLGQSAIALEGYRLADGDANPVWRYGFAGTLAPGGVLVASGSDSKAWEEANGFSAYGLSLNNGGDCIRLYRIAGADTSLVDSYTYTETGVLNDRAIGRRSDDALVWVNFDGYNPCTSVCSPPGTGCLPTPGSRNACTTPVESRSWGSLKSMYR